MTLARHYLTVQDTEGNAVPGAHIEVRREIPGQPLAMLFSDRAGIVALGNPFDAGGDGIAFFHVVGGAYQIRAYTGASGAPDFEVIQRYVAIGLNSESDAAGVKTQRTETASGAIVLPSDDVDIIFIDKTVAGPTAVTLPSSGARTKSVRIVDGKGDANTNKITISPASGDKIFGIVNYQYVIDGNGGSIELTPRAGGGWY